MRSLLALVMLPFMWAGGCAAMAADDGTGLPDPSGLPRGTGDLTWPAGLVLASLALRGWRPEVRVVLCQDATREPRAGP